MLTTSAWLVAFVVLGAVNWGLVKHLTGGKASTVSSVVSTANFTLSSWGLLLVTLDLVAVSDSSDETKAQIKCFAYVTVLLTLLCAVFFTPVAYYYSEDSHDLFEIGRLDRISDSLKFAGMFVLFVTVLVCVGLVVQQSPHDWSSLMIWLEEIFDSKHNGNAVLVCIVGIANLIGSLLWSCYIGYAFGVLPGALFTKQTSLTDLADQIDTSIERCQAKQRDILSGRTSNTGELEELSAQEAKLNAKKENLQKIIEANASSWVSSVSTVLCSTLRLVLATWSVFTASCLFTSLLSTNINRFLHSDCGFRCGFINNSARIFSPFDLLMANVSQETAFMVFVGAILSLQSIAIYALCDLGVRIFGIKARPIQLWEIKKADCHPQSLLIASVVSSFLGLVTYSQVAVAVPAFALYGSQVIDSALGKSQCSLSQVEACRKTLTSAFTQG
jgi:LMBR1 domain-containing protein 1